MIPNPVIRIALADDHTMFRKGLVSIIDTFDEIEVDIEAENGEDLLDKLDVANVLPDVCIMDISMPVLNGFDATLALNRLFPSIKVLGLSMHYHELSVLKMLQNGARGYLTKDEHPDELRKAIRTVYEKDYYHSEIVSMSLIHKLHDAAHQNALHISDTELKYLALTCGEYSYKEIADKMDLHYRTIQNMNDALCEKLGVKTRLGLVICCMYMGIISVNSPVH